MSLQERGSNGRFVRTGSTLPTKKRGRPSRHGPSPLRRDDASDSDIDDNIGSNKKQKDQESDLHFEFSPRKLRSQKKVHSPIESPVTSDSEDERPIEVLQGVTKRTTRSGLTVSDRFKNLKKKYDFVRCSARYVASIQLFI